MDRMATLQLTHQGPNTPEIAGSLLVRGNLMRADGAYMHSIDRSRLDCIAAGQSGNDVMASTFRWGKQEGYTDTTILVQHQDRF